MGEATYTAALLDELDAYRRWGQYVVAWCVKSPPIAAPLRETTAAERRGPVECEKDPNGDCFDSPPVTAAIPGLPSDPWWLAP